ncbi:MAG: hypothetical protein C0507_00330 [Cyanobacteria bacterium PR.3.49]|nr:hypothetical protein [Cyanobacteria bacterium PR.3.49]
MDIKTRLERKDNGSEKGCGQEAEDGSADRRAEGPGEPPDTALLRLAELPDAQGGDRAEGLAARRLAAWTDEVLPQELLQEPLDSNW